MLGAVIGDVVGSFYAFQPIKTKKFELFDVRCHFTDDSIFMAAVANVTRRYLESGAGLDYKAELQEELLRISWIYQAQDMAYSRHFSDWMFLDEPKPYGSAGVTAASRAIPIGFLATSLEQAEQLAKLSAEVTHNHDEGIKGAQCVAGCIFLAREKKSKEEIRSYLQNKYRVDFTLKALRPEYQYAPTCPQVVPPALMAFLEATDFEDAIRNAISLGGSDSLAAITGGVAEAFYGVPEEMSKQVKNYLDAEIIAALA